MPDHSGRYTRIGVVAALFAVSSSGCSDVAPEPATFQISDSAGVRIVHNAGPRLTGASAWRISAAPVVEIGSTDDPTQALHHVAGARLLSDQRIVVFQGSDPMLRWYSPSGEYLGGTGRTGAGPGEFGPAEITRVTAFWPLQADSVATWEHAARRMQIFSPDGEYSRAVIIDLPPNMNPLAYPIIVGASAEGLVAYIRRPSDYRPAGDVERDTVTYISYLADGSFAGTIATLPGYVSFWTEAESRGGSRVTSQARLPFGATPLAAVYGGHFYYSSADRFEVMSYDLVGRHRQSVRCLCSRVPLTADVVARYVADRLADVPSASTQRTRLVRDRLSGLPYPDSLPAYDRIHVDRLGSVWVRNHAIPGETLTEWFVFDDHGTWLTTVAMPSEFQLLDVGHDYVLVLARDDLDVERVLWYRLEGRA